MSSDCCSILLTAPLVSGVTCLSASSSSNVDTLNIWCENCRMWQLLYTITETLNTLFPIVNFLKCVVTEVALFWFVAFKTLDISQGSVATQWGVVWSLATVLSQIFSWLWQWNNFENQLTFDKVKVYKNGGANFGGHPVHVDQIGAVTVGVTCSLTSCPPLTICWR